MELVEMIWELRLFWLAMIILDAFIAFVVPAWKVQKKLESPSIANKLTDLYGITLYNKLKPEIKEDVRNIITEIKVSTNSAINHQINNIESKINSNITNINTNFNKKIDQLCTNDIPHMIEDKVKTIKTEIEDIPNQLSDHIEPIYEKINEVTTKMNRTFSSAGSMAKSEKALARKEGEKFLAMENPMTAMGLKKMKSELGLTSEQYDMALMNQIQKIRKKKAKESLENVQKTQEKTPVYNPEEMQNLQTGPQLQTVPEMQKTPESRISGMGKVARPVTSKEEEIAKQKFLQTVAEAGIDPNLYISAIEYRDIKKKKRIEQNGK